MKKKADRENEWQALLPEKQKLELADKCIPLIDPYSHLRNERRLLEEEKLQLKLVCREKEKTDKTLLSLKETGEEYEKQRDRQLVRKRETETVIQEVIQLDFICEKIDREANEIKLNITKNEKTGNRLNKERGECNLTVKEAEKKLETISGYLQTNSADQQLLESLTGIREKCNGLRVKSNQLSEISAVMDKLSTNIITLDNRKTELDQLYQTATAAQNEQEERFKQIENRMGEKSETEKYLQNLIRRSRDIEDKCKNVRHELALLTAEKDRQQDGLNSNKNELTALTTEITELITPFSHLPIEPSNIENILADLETRLITWKKKQQELLEQQKNIQELVQQQEQLRLNLTHLESHLEKEQQKLSSLRKEYGETRNKRLNLFGSKNPKEVEQTLSREIKALDNTLENHRSLYSQQEKTLVTLVERQKGIENSLSNRQKTTEQLEEKFTERLWNIGLVSEEAFSQAILPEAVRLELHRKISAAENRRIEVDTTLETIGQRLEKEKNKKISEEPVEDIRRRSSQQTEQLNLLQQELGALRNKLADHERLKEEQPEKQHELHKQKLEYDYWQQLHNLIGSADGKKFRNFAQGLTLEQMIIQANKTLLKLSDRYLLRRNPNHPLELNVIDAYQAGEIRSTANLSGGESFIVSLALALALSSMASYKVQVDSLFLDEGFGTLDEESLEIALETLSNLQRSGKLIGIISHVPLLKERIGVQLQLTAALDGTSRLEGPGVEKK